MYSEQNRAFNYAVAASIVLHGLLLFGVPQRDRASPEEPQLPIVARLVEPPAPAPVAAELPPQVEPVKPRARAKPVTREKPAPQPKAAAEPVADAPIAEKVEPIEPVPAPAPPPVIARADPAPQAPAPQAAPALADPGSLAQYRLQLISAAHKHKRYPRVALDNNWEGDVVVRMAVGANGLLAALTVQSSSGHPVLDQQALEMFKRASEMVQVPPALRGREFALELRAIYNLRDQDSG